MAELTQESQRLLADLERFANRTNATAVATGLTMVQMVTIMLPKIEQAAKDRAEFGPLGDNHHNAAKCPYCTQR